MYALIFAWTAYACFCWSWVYQVAGWPRSWWGRCKFAAMPLILPFLMFLRE